MLERTAESTDGILNDPPPTAYVDEFGDDAVTVRITDWLDADNRNTPAVILCQDTAGFPGAEQPDGKSTV